MAPCSVAVSPDGRSVYVASIFDNSLSVYSRNAAGDLFFRGCIANEGQSGCNDTGIDPLDGASSVTVSPDGRSVYVASQFEDSLSVYSRNAAGDVFFRGCIANEGQSGCNDTGIDPPRRRPLGRGQPGRHVRLRRLLRERLGHSLCARGAALLRGRRATIVGTAGRDRLRGTRGRDVIVALGGNDVVRSLAGNDLVCAGTGNDTVFAGDGMDVVFGGLGNDVLFGGSGPDTLRGEAGRDRLVGGLGRDRLLGGPGRDVVTQ